jgi:hypothetical protein
MDKTTFTATFKSGHTVTRSLPARSAERSPFTHAVLRTRPVAGSGARLVTFHRSEDEAKTVAGKRGEIVAVTR